MPDDEVDRIRLALPADADLRSVVEVTVAVIARRLGLSDDDVAAARVATGDAFSALLDADGGHELVEVEIVVDGSRLTARLHAGTTVLVVTAPADEPDPPA